MGMDAREDNQKLGGILNRAVRAILHHCGCTNPAEVTANVARQDSGALFM